MKRNLRRKVMVKQIQTMVCDFLFNDENKTKLIKALNDNIDIPFIGEETEEKYLTAIWDTVEVIFKKAILKM